MGKMGTDSYGLLILSICVHADFCVGRNINLRRLFSPGESAAVGPRHNESSW